MALRSFAEVKTFLTAVMKDQGQYERLSSAPHKDFWNHLTYDQFTNGNMPNLRIEVPILMKGNSLQSNLILSLRGEGPLFNPINGRPGPMPPQGSRFTQEQVEELANWIDDGCPE